MKVFISDDIYPKSLVFKKSKDLNTKLKIIPIKYKENKENTDLYLQTSLMCVPFGINKYKNKYYISLSFDNYKNNELIMSFYQKIEQINTHIKSFIESKYENDLYFDDSIKYTENYPPLLRINIPNINNISIYNENRQKLDIKDIKEKMFCNAIIHLPYIWHTEDNYGISWKLIQMKKVEMTDTIPYSFIDVNVNNPTSKNNSDSITNNTDLNEKKIIEIEEKDKIKNHPEYKKYFDMLRYRVPKESIKNKLMMCNIDVNIIDLDPEGPVPKSISNESVKETDFNFVEVSLNKVTLLDKIKQKTNYDVPSLDDILQSKAKLTKTNYELKNITIAPETQITPIKPQITIPTLPTRNELLLGISSLKSRKPKVPKNQNAPNIILNTVPTKNELLLGISALKSRKTKA